MAKSQETFSKKEAEKKKIQKRKAKEERREERKANAKSGSLEDMLAYVDEYGNITSTPPDPLKRKSTIKTEDIVLGARNNVKADPLDAFRTGKVTFFNDSKGYGFIKDLKSQESIFVHANSLTEAIKENDKVSFEVEQGPKGLSAVRVKKTS